MAAPHSLPDSFSPAARKAALRSRGRAIRAAQVPAAAGRLRGHLLAWLAAHPAPAIAGTWPLPDEPDLRPLWHALHAQGRRILLPHTPRRGAALIFRVWTPATVMLREPFGTLRPDGPEAVPDLIVVPFLAFDAAGHRLGYGGGYYDRTLAALPHVTAIGAGHAALQVDSLPVEPHDRRLDAIFTEHGGLYPPPDATKAEPA